VKLGGVKVGRVDAIELEPDYRTEQGVPEPVKMRLEVDPSTAAALHEDASVAVATQGPLGEAYLELKTGSPSRPALAPGAFIHGTEPVRIDQMISRFGNLLNTTANSLAKNPDAIPKLVDSLGKLTARIDEALAKDPEALGTMLTELSQTAKDLHGVMARTHALLGPEGKATTLLSDASASMHVLRKDLPAITQDAKTSLHGLAAVSGQLDEQDGKRLKDAIARYAQAGEHLDQIAARADKILTEIDQGKGSIGGLLKDPKLYQDVKDLVSELKKHPWRILWKD
jgi:phospholipid/cholesterol/gamma-HCH transport system substrate-binding protein